MANAGLMIEFDDKTVTLQRRGKKVSFIFGNEADAEKFWIAYAEGARLGAKISLTTKQIA